MLRKLERVEKEEILNQVQDDRLGEKMTGLNNKNKEQPS